MTIAHRDRAHRDTADDFDVDDAALHRFDLVREGARRDGVEIVHYAPRFPVRGTRAEKRVERTIALMLTSAACSRSASSSPTSGGRPAYEPGVNETKFYTPLLGLDPGRVAVLPGLRASSPGPRSCCPRRSRSRTATTAPRRATSRSSPGADDRSTWSTRPASSAGRCSRRPSCCRPPGLGVAAAAPLVGSLIKNPNDGHILLRTGWSPVTTTGRKYA